MLVTRQLLKDLDNLQQGACWIGYNALQVLEGLDATSAQTRAYVGGNTIWQIVNHICFWRELVARRVNERKPVQTELEGFDTPAFADETSWKATLERFQNSYQVLREAIASLPESELYLILEGDQTMYYNIEGCILHDSFHLGQVILLKRMAGIRA